MPKDSNADTNIVDTKAAFLRAQTRLLSNPLQPSPDWQSLTTKRPDPSESSSAGSPAPISEKTLTDILTKVNAKLKSHNRLVFSLPSQRHVAEQLDTLYWNEVTSESLTNAKDIVWVPLDADLTESNVIAGLPETLRLSTDTEENDDAEARYVELKTRAAELSQRRDELKKTVEAYRQLRRLLAPFEDVKKDVQPNLVGKDGELAREMERTKVLVARIMGGLQGMQGKDMFDGGAEDGQEREVLSEQERLARVMDLG